MATNVIGDVGGKLAAQLFSSIIWITLGFFIFAAILGTGWYVLVYKKKFDIKVKIISKRAEDKNNILFDKAAILYDRKTKSKYFRLWKNNTELPVPHFNILQKTNEGDYIEIYRTGEDRFFYLLPPKLGKKYLIDSNGQITPVIQQSINSIDPDLSFWAVKRKDTNRSMFDPDKPWMKLLPYIPQILAGVFIIFILYLLMKYLPDILAQMKELANTLKDQQNAQIITNQIWKTLLKV